MGIDEATCDRTRNLSFALQVDARLMELPPIRTPIPSLPARASEQGVSDAVIDGPQSAVWTSENRLHAQKAVLAWCFAGA